jgi:hypothetical protein
MPRYAIIITINASRLPDRFPPSPAIDPASDPMREMVGVLRESMQKGATFFPPREKESGVSMAKGIEVSAESFEGLTQILAKFDHLAEEIECSHPAP